MILLLGFAFFAGVVTILSPCILPILPIVLSGAVGGKMRPFGVIIGFIGSFTFFTLFLATIIQAIGLPADSLRAFSIIIIFLFGLSLLIPQIQVYLEQLFSKLSGTVSQKQRTGFGGGLLIGLSLGLIWTPCVGPILASVISLALSGTVSGTAFFITLAYSIGTAIPMFTVMVGGRKLLQKVPWLLQNSGGIQKVFGVLMILTAVAIFFNIDRKFQTYVLEAFPNYGVGLTQFEDNTLVNRQLKNLKNQPAKVELKGKLAPELILGGRWFNSPPRTMQSLRGKVVLVDFWTYTCINCIRTLPYLRTWHQKYADKGLMIIGVHSPEFPFEKEEQNVAEAIADFKLQYPVMQDNNFATWRAYNNHYWPAKYLIDKDGYIRYHHFGEGEYDETERVIQELLKESGSSVSEISIDNPSYKVEASTPELYLGHWRIEYLASPETIVYDAASSYSIPKNLGLHRFGYGGTWSVGEYHAMPKKRSILELQFESKEVFLVMKSAGKGIVSVLIDGKPVEAVSAGVDVKNSMVTVTTDRLYKLIKLPQSGKHHLRLEFMDDGLELYAFTFG